MLLLDIAMPGMNGLDVARRLAERGDDVKVVMLSAREDRDALFSAISAGARGYVAKDAEPDQLFAAIDLVLRGGTVLSTGVAQNLGEGIRQLDYAPGAYEQRRLALTDRELEILRLLATPKSPAQMAPSSSCRRRRCRTTSRRSTASSTCAAAPRPSSKAWSCTSSTTKADARGLPDGFGSVVPMARREADDVGEGEIPPVVAKTRRGSARSSL